MAFNFDRIPSKRANTFNLTYDYKSIMHYSASAFAKKGTKTIEPIIISKLVKNTKLSKIDIQSVRHLYGCAAIKPID